MSDDSELRGIPENVRDRILADVPGENGDRVIACLGAARTLLDLASEDEDRALRPAESAAFNLREALDSVVRAVTAPASGLRTALDAWTKYTQMGGRPGWADSQGWEAFSSVMKRLAADSDRQERSSRELITWFSEQTGLPPLRAGHDLVQQYRSLRKDVNRIVHGEGTVGEVERLYDESVAWFSRLFELPSRRRDRIAELAGEQHTPKRMEELTGLILSSHHLRLFLERLQHREWLVALRSNGLLALPEPGEPWPALVLADSTLLSTAEVAAFLEGFLPEIRSLAEPARDSCASQLAWAAYRLGHEGHALISAMLQSYAQVGDVRDTALAVARAAEPDDPIQLTVVDGVIDHCQRRRDRSEAEEALRRLVDGLTSANTEERTSVLCHKLRRFSATDKGRMWQADTSALTDLDSISDHVRFGGLLAHYIAASVLRARSIGVPTDRLLRIVDPIPGVLGERIKCHVLVGGGDRRTKVDHLIVRVADDLATADDKILIDDLSPFDADEVSQVRKAFGSPPLRDAADGTDVADPAYVRAWRWSAVLPEGALTGWESGIAEVSKVHGEPDPQTLFRPLPTSIAGWGSSPISVETLTGMGVYGAARMVASWRPDPDGWGQSARELGRALQRVVSTQPTSWTKDPVAVVRALHEPVYIYHYFEGLIDSAADIGERASVLIDAVELVATEPWPPFPLGRDNFEYDPDWSLARRASVETIAALAENDAEYGHDLTRCWPLVLALTQDVPANLNEPADDGFTDPFTRAINSSYGKGLHAALCLAAWEHRNLGAVEGPFEELLAWVLTIDGTVGLTLRAVLAAHRPLLEHIASDWIVQNWDGLFGGPLGAATFAQTLRYSNMTPMLADQGRRELLSAARCGSNPAIQLVSIAYLQGHSGFAFDDIAAELAGTDAAFEVFCNEVPMRVVEAPVDSEAMKLAVDSWERLVTAPTPARPGKVLRGLGLWAEVKSVDSETWLRLTQETVELTDGEVEGGVRVAERCRDLQPSAEGLSILICLVGRGERWEQGRIDALAEEALRIAIEEGATNPAADELRERLIARGRHDVA